MKFFYISDARKNRYIKTVLSAACQKRDIPFVAIDPRYFDFTDSSISPQQGDLLYRASITQPPHSISRTVERFLLHENVVTFYKSYEQALATHPQSYVIHEKAGLSQPKTIWSIPTNRSKIKKYVAAVGGFPVIIKATGGSHGVGVMKVDSLSSLVSIIDFLLANDRQVIMRQFINVNTSARLIVLGNKIISSIEYTAPTDDFRTNVGSSPSVQPKTFSDDVNKLAIAAVNTLGFDFGGVDILIDAKGQAFITEVNFPCNFGRAQKITGDDIAGKMIDYLVNKANGK